MLWLQGQEGVLAGEKWCEFLIECKDEVSKTHKLEQQARPLYRGELEVLHGKRGAAEIIAKKKWKEVVDGQGDIRYVKVSDAEIKTKERKQPVELKRTTDIIVLSTCTS